MLSFFRRIINSKFGVYITMGVLVLIALAFALGDVTGLRTGGAPRGATGDVVATVGKVDITLPDLKRRVQSELASFRQEQPTLDMAQFIAGGGLEGTLERYINGLALEQFAQKHGMVVGKSAIDGQIASIPQLKGLSGKFDETVFQRFLAAQGQSADAFRTEVARSMLTQLLTAPTLGASQVPDRLALPYASLLLEKRSGTIGIVPTTAIAKGPPPNDQQIAAFYKANIARYVVPERRTIRYALVAIDQIKAQAVPTEAEIAAAYKAQAAKYAARETRSITQVVLADKAAADALAAKVRGGTPIEAAAKGAGLEAAKLTNLEKTAYAAQSSTDIANTAFSGAKGSVVGPVKAPLGWIVARVEGIAQIAAKSLDQARPELSKQLSEEKGNQRVLDLRNRIDTALNGNATFDELVRAEKLTAAVTPPMLANGRDATNPAANPDPKLAQVVAAGFAAEQGDAPQLVPVGNDGSFAIVAVDRITAAAPAPLATLKAQIANDIWIDTAHTAARKVAAAVVAKINGGMPISAALAASGLTLPPTKPIAAQRAQLAALEGRVPPPLALLFSMAGKTAKLLEAPNNNGWYIIYLDTIEHGDARDKPAVIAGMRADIGRSLGNEYIAQFAQAVRREVGVSKNAATLAKLRAELAGTAQP